MFVWWNKRFRQWRRNEDGVMAIEFGIMLPLMLSVVIVLIELGMLFYDATMVKKGLRAGAQYAARSTFADLDPLDSDLKDLVYDIVICGDAESASDCADSALYMKGWSNCGTTCITLTVSDETISPAVGDDFVVTVITLATVVEYIPFFDGLFGGGNFGTMNIRAQHQQVHIGF